MRYTGHGTVIESARNLGQIFSRRSVNRIVVRIVASSSYAFSVHSFLKNFCFTMFVFGD
jgi:hypothetical protein